MIWKSDLDQRGVVGRGQGIAGCFVAVALGLSILAGCGSRAKTGPSGWSESSVIIPPGPAAFANEAILAVEARDASLVVTNGLTRTATRLDVAPPVSTIVGVAGSGLHLFIMYEPQGCPTGVSEVVSVALPTTTVEVLAPAPEGFSCGGPATKLAANDTGLLAQVMKPDGYSSIFSSASHTWSEPVPMPTDQFGLLTPPRFAGSRDEFFAAGTELRTDTALAFVNLGAGWVPIASPPSAVDELIGRTGGGAIVWDGKKGTLATYRDGVWVEPAAIGSSRIDAAVANCGPTVLVAGGVKWPPDIARSQVASECGRSPENHRT